MARWGPGEPVMTTAGGMGREVHTHGLVLDEIPWTAILS